MDLFVKYWQNFKSRPDIWFFYAFLATSTLSIRKVLFFYPINGSFNEYTGVYLYLSDIFLFLTIIAWLFLLCNNYNVLSILKRLRHDCSTLAPCSEIVPRGTISESTGWNNSNEKIIKKVYQQIVNNYLIIFPLFLGLFSFLSILWATNQPIALFRSIKLFEFILLYFYLAHTILRLHRNKKLFHVEQFAKQADKDNCSTWNNLKENIDTIVPRGTILKNTLSIIISIGFIQAIIGIVQFLKQSSVGFFWLKESLISPQILGVAKVIFHGQPYVRAYGLFPHPNILGGFLVFSIIATLLYFRLFYAYPVKCSTLAPCSEIVPRGTISESTGWNILKEKVDIIVPRLSRRMFHVEHSFWDGTIMLYIILLIQGLALSFTFSKSAFFGLILGLFYIFIRNRLGNFPFTKNTNLLASHQENYQMSQIVSPQMQANCSTWNNFLLRVRRGRFFDNLRKLVKMFHVEHFKRKIALIGGIVILLFAITKPDTFSLLFKSLQERDFYLNVSRGTFLSHPLLGVGSGQFISDMVRHYKVEIWRYQPVHNVFLLMLNEFGIFILLAFLYFLFKLFHVEQFKRKDNGDRSAPENSFHSCPAECSTWNNLSNEQMKKIVPRGTISNETTMPFAINVYFKAILVAFTFIMLFDHYLWDIQQGMLMLWSVLAMCAISNIVYNE